MTAFSALDPHWASPIAFVVIALGIMFVWRGLRGGRDGEQALLGQRIDMLNRIEGFRLIVFGLVRVGIGAAVIWRAEWLLLMALGIGFVEILESSALIAVWRWGRRRGEAHRTLMGTAARQTGGRSRFPIDRESIAG